MSKERPRLLVIDTAEADNATLRELLGLYNYEVLEVNDSDSAIRLLQETLVDAQLISVELPEGGFEASQKIREHLSLEDLPLAFVTSAEYDHTMLMEAQFYGAMFLMRKPYAAVEALTQLSSMIRIKFLQDELKQHFAELERLASTDPLTGMFNRRLLFIRLEQELARVKRVSADLCLAYLDIDHFKHINDTYGHLAGDEILRRLSRVMNTVLRKSDVMARMGGEEFLIMLPDTGEEGARYIAERLRAVISETLFDFEGQQIPVTVSFGVVHAGPENDDEPDDLVRKADQALYYSKHHGRNRVSVWGVDCGPQIEVTVG
jgi:two-component system cell cycle response regulator